MGGFDIRAFIHEAASAGEGADTPARIKRPAVPLAETVEPRVVRAGHWPVMVVSVARCAEFALVILAGLAAHGFYSSAMLRLDTAQGLATLATAMSTIIAFQAVGAYSIAAFRSLFAFGLRIVFGWSLVFLVLLAIVFLGKLDPEFSRAWLMAWFVLGLGLLLAERIILAMLVSILARSGRFDRRVAIVGGGELAETMIRALSAQRDTGIQLVGVFDDRADERSPDVVGGYPKLGTVDDLVAYAREAKLDLVVIALPLSAEKRLLQILRKLWVLPVDIRLSAHSSRLRLRPRAYSYIGTVPLLDLFDRPISHWDLVLKKLFDKIVGSALLLAMAPVLLMTAIAIKLNSRGPVFLRERRQGFGNEAIEVLNFRSTYADEMDAAVAKPVTGNDPQVTRVGRILRKTSLDRLPQLLNVVFKGDLSLVGPRPHAPQAEAEDRLYERAVDGYLAHHKVRPGITGWAQVNGWRGETKDGEHVRRRVEHDLYYVENWSVFFDLYILLKTPFALKAKPAG